MSYACITCVCDVVTQPKYMKPEMCINLPATKRLLTKDVRYPVETKSISAPDMVDPSQPKWAVIVVGLPELPLTLKRARIEPMLAPSASNDISGSFHRARLLFPILHVSIQRNQRNSIGWWTEKRQQGKKNQQNSTCHSPCGLACIDVTAPSIGTEIMRLRSGAGVAWAWALNL